MPRLMLALLVGVALVLTLGCAPAVTVNNKTTFPIRVMIRNRGNIQWVSPSPSESSFVEVGEGLYFATAIPDAEWTTYATAKRRYLNEQLANSQNLSGEKLLQVIQQLKEIAAQMQKFADAADSNARCSGRVTEDATDTVTVTSGADGKLKIGCAHIVSKKSAP